MFKYKIFLKLLVLFAFFYLPLFADDTQQMTIRLNGHEYQVDDIFSKKVKEMYNEKKSDIKQDIRTEIINTQPDVSLNLSDITLPDNISVNYFFI